LGPLALGREWGYHGRIAQIIKALDRADPIDLDAMQAIQYDITSPIAQNLLPVMLEQLQGAELNADAKALQSKLQNWDLKTGMNDSEPLIFFTWMRETIRLVFQDELGPSFDGWFSLRVTPLERVLKDRPVWCDNIRAAPIEDCPTILAQALARANTWLQDKYGDDPGDWHWGDAHSARFRHLAFGFIPVLNRLFDIRLPAPGSQESVNRAAFHISNEAEPFAQGHGPGLRALYDIADLEKSRFIIGPGQSGRLFSANRSSMTKPWRDGGLIRLAPIASPLHLLILQPKAVP
jgi:penicillin amidase